MPDELTELRPADPDDVRQAIEFALSFDGKRRFAMPMVWPRR